MIRPKQFDEEGNEVEPEEEELEEGQEKNFDGYIKDSLIIPGSCIILKGSDKQLINRVKSLPED